METHRKNIENHKEDIGENIEAHQINIEICIEEHCIKHRKSHRTTYIEKHKQKHSKCIIWISRCQCSKKQKKNRHRTQNEIVSPPNPTYSNVFCI